MPSRIDNQRGTYSEQLHPPLMFTLRPCFRPLDSKTKAVGTTDYIQPYPHCSHSQIYKVISSGRGSYVCSLRLSLIRAPRNQPLSASTTYFRGGGFCSISGRTSRLYDGSYPCTDLVSRIVAKMVESRTIIRVPLRHAGVSGFDPKYPDIPSGHDDCLFDVECTRLMVSLPRTFRANRLTPILSGTEAARGTSPR